MTATLAQPVPALLGPDDLAQVIHAYTQTAQNLQRSHVALHEQVLRLQEQLAGANAQLQRSKRLAALGEMAAGIAHEIRNPLAAISLYARMIVEDLAASNHPHSDTAEKIAQAVRGLNAIVNDVLAFAREINPRTGPVAAALLFERVIDAHRPAIEQAHVRVVRQGDLSHCFTADPDLLHQALLNLVRNAVDAMADSPQRLLTLTCEHDAAATVLRVSDTGPGVPEDVLDRIFNPFFTTRSTGTGLGLAIVHRIADAHSGTIALRNERGAVFELILPHPSGTPNGTQA